MSLLCLHPQGSRQAIRTIINSLLFIDDDWLILLVVIEECQYSIHECLSFRISTYGFKRESQYKSLVVALVGHTGTQVVFRIPHHGVCIFGCRFNGVR